MICTYEPSRQRQHSRFRRWMVPLLDYGSKAHAERSRCENNRPTPVIGNRKIAASNLNSTSFHQCCTAISGCPESLLIFEIALSRFLLNANRVTYSHDGKRLLIAAAN
jgi:hypothetical protein